VEPTSGSVVFGSGLHGWGFSLHTFARFYAAKFNTTVDKMTEKLWGDWVFASTNGHSRWIESQTVTANYGVDVETGSKRSFIAFIMDPIMAMVHAVMNNTLTKAGVLKAFPMAKQIGVELTDEERSLTGKPLLKRIMRKWLSLTDSLLEMTVVHLPSPITAQQYRTEILYDGPLDDATATAMRLCESSDDTPLIMHVSRMLYRPGVPSVQN
jgi:elongation factor 2